MPVSLSKGGNVSLSKEAPGLKAITVGLGWKARVTDGAPFDLDASVFMLGENGKVKDDNGFVFYGGPVKKQGEKAPYTESVCGSVVHTGDNRVGDADGDDEAIKINLEAVPADVVKLAFSVTIHDADARKQNFGMVSDAYIRVVNQDGGTEIARYDLSEDASTETAMVFGELYRHNGEWKFKAIGQGFAGGLGPLATNYGVNIG